MAGAVTRSGEQPAARTRARAALPRSRTALLVVVAAVVVVGFLLIGVFPTRTWLAQRDEAAAREAELAELREEEAAYEERIVELETAEEIEQIAREEHGMVREGETPYRVLPPTVAPVELPDTWPFAGADDWLNR